MAGCPLRNFEYCPQHNKKGGCQFWMTYSNSAAQGDAQMEGCAVVLTPVLLVENARVLGAVAGEVNKVGHEVSAGRAETVRATGTMASTILGLVQPVVTAVTIDAQRRKEVSSSLQALSDSEEHCHA